MIRSLKCIELICLKISLKVKNLLYQSVSQIEELLNTFLKSRSAKGKPVSDFVFQKLLKDLEQFSGQNIQVAREILEKSIL